MMPDPAETGASGAARTNVENAIPRIRSQKPSPHACPNCDALVVGRFCSECGQEHVEDRTVGAMLRDFGGELVGADSRLWRTLRVLVVRPGGLSVEHRAGRRARYLEPSRLYLIASVVFFSAIAFAPVQLVQVGTGDGDPARVRAGSGVRIETSGLQTDGAELTGIWAAMARAEADPDRVNDIFLRSFAWVMFILIPIFAALLQLLFRGAGLLYVQHFVFALHFHAFAFLTQAAAYAAMHLPLGGANAHAVLILVAMAGSVIYLYLALRRFYGSSAPSTIGRIAALGLAYFPTIALAMIGTLILALLLFF